ncbi:MAG TPA: hypothetical protein VH209_06050 [Steroidobacteraceae bacterium]|nr:hypothetical protein [Steroidobacteraceae bacterium]
MTILSRLATRAVILAVALSACTTLPGTASPEEYLDPETAATISIVGKPLVFAHERPERAAHMRDYVTLAAAAVNRSGKTDYVLVAYDWTTFDEHGRSGETASAATTLVVAADDRRITLSLAGHSAHDVGIGTPVHPPPAGSATPDIYRTDLATMRFIAAARHLEVLKQSDAAATAYPIWDDQRAALGVFVDLLSGGQAGRTGDLRR